MKIALALSVRSKRSPGFRKPSRRGLLERSILVPSLNALGDLVFELLQRVIAASGDPGTAIASVGMRRDFGAIVSLTFEIRRDRFKALELLAIGELRKALGNGRR